MVMTKIRRIKMKVMLMLTTTIMMTRITTTKNAKTRAVINTTPFLILARMCMHLTTSCMTSRTHSDATYPRWRPWGRPSRWRCHPASVRRKRHCPRNWSEWPPRHAAAPRPSDLWGDRCERTTSVCSLLSAFLHNTWMLDTAVCTWVTVRTFLK